MQVLAPPLPRCTVAARSEPRNFGFPDVAGAAAGEFAGWPWKPPGVKPEVLLHLAGLFYGSCSVIYYQRRYSFAQSAFRGRPRRLRASRGLVPGPSRSRISINPRPRRFEGGSPSRRAISRSKARQRSLHMAARTCSNCLSRLRACSGGRLCPWRHERTVALATRTLHSRARITMAVHISSNQ